MFLAALALHLTIHAAALQVAAADTLQDPRYPVVPLVAPGSAEEDRIRGLQLLGPEARSSRMLRAPSTAFGSIAAEQGSSIGIIAPRLGTVWNSDLPFSFNEGTLWAARGLSTRVRLGVFAHFARVSVVLAPELVYSENGDYQTFSRPEEADRERHPFASPFHYPPYSVDLPSRLGDESTTSIEPGQSSLTIDASPIAFGAATESLWWGPGVHNALVMSSNAPGIPHLFLRTSRPLETRAGSIEGRLILGRLAESPYFDFDSSNDHRSLSALALTFTPSIEPGLTVGVTRAVYAPADGAGIPIGAALDVFRSVGRPAAEPGDSLLAPGPDQIFSIFGRWHFPESGLETYFEWGRYEQPASLRDFVETPNHTQGYTLGAQWARPAGESLLRIQTEVTFLEPSTTYRIRPTTEWYSSRRVPQGYTHRGRVIGASIGPSGSSQWLAADLLSEGWHGGVFAGRIRWENSAQFTYTPEYRYADVSIFAGLRGGADLGIVGMDLQLGQEIRYNYLFQARPAGPFRHRGVDIHNRMLRLTLRAATGGE